MKVEKYNSPTIKKSHIIYLLVAIALFLAGIFIGSFILSSSGTSKAVEDCRKFCEFIPNTEFSHVGPNNRCFCIQRNQLFDSTLNKTMTYTQVVDAGIIMDVKIN